MTEDLISKPAMIRTADGTLRPAAGAEIVGTVLEAEIDYDRNIAYVHEPITGNRNQRRAQKSKAKKKLRHL